MALAYYSTGFSFGGIILRHNDSEIKHQNYFNYLPTYPPYPLPLQGKGEINKREASPLFNSPTFGVSKKG